MKLISTKCQHFLWEYKRELTTSDYLDGITNERCKSILGSFDDCKNVKSGHKVPCLVDHKAEVD